MRFMITPDGTIRCLYGEMLDLASLGVLTIRRASHVEPDTTGHWMADLTPSAGPLLGPFPTRSAALAAEIEWLLQHRLQIES